MNKCPWRWWKNVHEPDILPEREENLQFHQIVMKNIYNENCSLAWWKS